MNSRELRAVAVELNRVVQPDPKINTKAKMEELDEGVRATAALLEDGDVLTQETIDCLLEMEIDLPAKIKSPGKKSTQSNIKKPGVISAIIEMLTEKPHSKEEILKKLAKKFPEREPESMKKTINIQVGTRIQKDKGLIVLQDNDKFFIK